jgi:hypothetical protein
LQAKISDANDKCRQGLNKRHSLPHGVNKLNEKQLRCQPWRAWKALP